MLCNALRLNALLAAGILSGGKPSSEAGSVMITALIVSVFFSSSFLCELCVCSRDRAGFVLPFLFLEGRCVRVDGWIDA